jgi:hypothetical protein
MSTGLLIFGSALLAGQSLLAAAQDPKQLVSQAVQTELTASENDHSRWIYYDIDRKPSGTVQQWVAETGNGDVHRILAQKGSPLSPSAQRNIMEEFIRDPSAQSRQRKSGEHDDQQSADMLRLLPDAFLWTIADTQGHTILLHFVPDPQFKPPTWESRVFAAMEGSMRIEKFQHRIVSLQGRLVHTVRFCGGLCGSLSAGRHLRRRTARNRSFYLANRRDPRTHPRHCPVLQKYFRGRRRTENTLPAAPRQHLPGAGKNKTAPAKRLTTRFRNCCPPPRKSNPKAVPVAIV